MGKADALTGTLRSHRPARRRTGRRLRAEILCGPYPGAADAYVEIKSGRFTGGMAGRDKLDDIGLRVPTRGWFRLIAATSPNGPHEAYGFSRGILRVKRVADVWGPMFCWLPRAFRGRRVRLTVAPPKRRASAKAARGAKSPRRQQP